MNHYLNWKVGGLLLGVAFFLAIFLVKPIGVSTQFSVVSGMLQNAVDESLISEDPSSQTGYTSTNAYMNKSQGTLAKSIVEPINYSNIFVLSIILGGFLSSLTIKKDITTQEEAKLRQTSPHIFRQTISSRPAIRYLLVFMGGAISLFGARLAGGCTSGHMMSGISQTALSGMVFAAVVFAVAIPTALLLYRKKN